MALRRQQSHGTWYWVVDYRDGRGKRRRKFFRDPDYQAAVQFSIAQIGQQHARRRDGPTYSVENILDGFLNATRARRRTAAQQSVKARLSVVLRTIEGLGVHYAHELSESLFPRLREALAAAGYAEQTIHGYLAAFRSAVRYAQRRGAVPAGLMGDMRLPNPQTVRKRFLSKDEIETLLAALAGHPLQRAVAVGVFQGLRIQEVCDLCEGDLDLGGGLLSVGGRVVTQEGQRIVLHTKNNETRTIRLHRRLTEYLPANEGSDGAPLCPNTKGGRWTRGPLARALRRHLDELGQTWENVSFHTLRHSCASQMAMAGHTLYEIQVFLGHRSMATTAKYAHLLPDTVNPDW